MFVLLGIFGIKLLFAMFDDTNFAEAPAPAAVVAKAPVPQPKAPASPSATAAPAKTTEPAAPAKTSAPVAAAGTQASPSSAEFVELGKTTYANCVACHGPDGKGPPIKMNPPMAPILAGSEFVNGPTERIAYLVLKGAMPDMKRHVGAMIGWGASMKR